MNMTDRIKEHFEEEAEDFDRIIVNLIPHYLQMVEAVVLAIPFTSSERVRVVDLGCGTGTVANHVLERFPNAEVICVDLAEKMIGMAQSKLARHKQVRYFVDDFSTFRFEGDYDVVVSSLALHHLASDEEKRQFYGQIFRMLRPGGVFYNADVVLASGSFLQSLYMEQWRNFMLRKVSSEEIVGIWLPKYEAEDRPARLTDHLTWLSGAGFVEVDVIWKYYNFAVYGGRRL
jgi:tRNA (cmo5U34)-methyltransferase